MSNVLVEESCLQDIANAIRGKNKGTDKYKPSEMAGAIKALTTDINIVSPDNWKFNVIQVEHQNITATPVSKIISNSDGTYSSALNCDISITSDTGYIPGTIEKSVDETNKIYNVTSGPAEETSMIKDGWAQVYEDGSNFYSDAEYSKSIYPVSGQIVVIGMKNGDCSSNNYYTLSLSSDITKYKNSFLTKAKGAIFQSSNKTTEVYLPNLIYANGSLLEYCTTLKKVDLSNLTDAPNDDVLSNCTSLEEINLSQLTNAGWGLLHRCTSLKKANLPNLKTVNGALLHSCTSLKEVNLSNLISVNGSYFLEYCSSLEEINLPKLEDAGKYPFWNCSSLKSIFLQSDTMCSKIDNELIYFGSITSPSIYVPESLIDSYKTADCWKANASLFKTLESIELSKISISGSDSIKLNETQSYTIVYNDGVSIPEQRGVTWTITGNATISDSGVVTLTNSATTGENITIKATSTYNKNISVSKTITVA